MTRQTFFEHTVLERDIGDDLLELPVLGPQLFDFVAGGLPDGVSCQLLLARLQEVLAPALVEVGGDALATAQLGDALLAAKALEHDADLLLGCELPAGPTTDLPHGGFGRLLLRS